MIEQEEAVTIIVKALESINEELPEEERIEADRHTALFGAEARIDSLSLVSLIVDVESAVSERVGRSVVLTDDRAMSRPIVPFTTVQTLAEYVVELSRE